VRRSLPASRSDLRNRPIGIVASAATRRALRHASECQPRRGRRLLSSSRRPGPGARIQQNGCVCGHGGADLFGHGVGTCAFWESTRAALPAIVVLLAFEYAQKRPRGSHVLSRDMTLLLTISWLVLACMPKSLLGCGPEPGVGRAPAPVGSSWHLCPPTGGLHLPRRAKFCYQQRPPVETLVLLALTSLTSFSFTSLSPPIFSRTSGSTSITPGAITSVRSRHAGFWPRRTNFIVSPQISRAPVATSSTSKVSSSSVL
jgi:hypothetical protein